MSRIFASALFSASLAVFAFCFALPAWASVFSPDAGTVDLSAALDFEGYVKTGADDHVKAMRERFGSYAASKFFEDEAKKIGTPVTLLMIGMMYCPDCKTAAPFMEAMARLNPLVTTRYIVRNDAPGAREFMIARTGRQNMPSIFVLRDDGKVLDGAYVETPSRVSAMLESADEGERDAIWDDFHSGAYDEDVQRDLIALVKNAVKEKGEK
ncbi:MAG: thioredoxin family protein [Synergistaceae bacterium]|jgi:glutaredoxin|nr:thioredoxin family protein [Synergistaceae bacterium]